jgi:hypothetical protein
MTAEYTAVLSPLPKANQFFRGPKIIFRDFHKGDKKILF